MFLSVTKRSLEALLFGGAAVSLKYVLMIMVLGAAVGGRLPRGRLPRGRLPRGRNTVYLSSFVTESSPGALLSLKHVLIYLGAALDAALGAALDAALGAVAVWFIDAVAISPESMV